MDPDEGTNGELEGEALLEERLAPRESFGRLNELGFVRVDFPKDPAVYMVGNVGGDIVVYRHPDYDAVTRESLAAQFTLHARASPLGNCGAGSADDEKEQTDEDHDGETDF